MYWTISSKHAIVKPYTKFIKLSIPYCRICKSSLIFRFKVQLSSVEIIFELSQSLARSFTETCSLIRFKSTFGLNLWC